MYEVRLKFPHVPVSKHFREERFNSLESLDDFINGLDPKEYESYEIREINILDRVCISSNYCPSRVKCKRCVFRRRENIEISDLFN